MGPWETAIEALWGVGFFGLLAALLVFILAYYALTIAIKRSGREPKRYEKIAFFVLAVVLALLIFVFSLGEGAALVLTYVSFAFFIIVLFLLAMVLFMAFFGKEGWKFWE